jgi:hypothetical protein
MTALAVICMLAVAISIPRDLFFPASRDLEVWLGFEVTGWAAWLTAPIHWAVFAAGAWGFWRCRPWVLPWAAAYLFYAAISHLVWSEASPNGRGWPIGLAQAAAISAVAGFLLRASRSRRSPPQEGTQGSA